MEYQTFVGGLAELPLGKEIELIVRELTLGRRKYNSHRVKAVLSREVLPESHTLWVRSRTGVRYSTPLFMRIAQEMELLK